MSDFDNGTDRAKSLIGDAAHASKNTVKFAAKPLTRKAKKVARKGAAKATSAVFKFLIQVIKGIVLAISHFAPILIAAVAL